MDVWYFNFENTSYIESLAKDWVSGCKINRIIQTGEGYVSLFDYLQTLPKEEFKKVSVKTTKGERCFWTFAKNVSLKKHNQRVRVVFSYLDEKLTGEPKVLVTNKLNWDIKTILETYLLRWKIDAFYRDAKQELGLEDYEVRKLQGLKRHWLMVFLADTLLQLNAKADVFVKCVKSDLKTVGSTCRYATLEILRSFISLVLKLAEKAKTADEILKYTLSDLKEIKTLYQMELS